MESRWIYGVHVESIWNLWGSVKYSRNRMIRFIRYYTNSINSSVTHHRGSEIDEILMGHRSQGPATKSLGQSKNWVLFLLEIDFLLTSFEQPRN